MLKRNTAEETVCTRLEVGKGDLSLRSHKPKGAGQQSGCRGEERSCLPPAPRLTAQQ